MASSSPSRRRRVGPACSPGGLVCAAAALVCACNDASDACVGLAEEGYLLAAYLTDDGARARAEVEFRRPDDDAGLPLPLCKGSALYVDGERASRVRRPSGASVYKAEIAVIEGTALEHTFTLVDDKFRDEYAVTIEAPAFEITAPAPGVELSRAATWDIAWTPARPGAKIRARVDDVVDGEACLGAPIELELPDEGAAQISPGQLKVDAAGLPTIDQCDATIHLSREAAAPLARVDGGDSRLHPDSGVLAATTRELPFTSVP